MKLLPSGLRLSASDLANHLGCRHLTLLDRGVAEGRIEASKWRDPALQVMAERGLEHERQYLAHLEEQKLEVGRLPEEGPEAELHQTEGTWMASGSGTSSPSTSTLEPST